MVWTSTPSSYLPCLPRNFESAWDQDITSAYITRYAQRYFSRINVSMGVLCS